MKNPRELAPWKVKDYKFENISKKKKIIDEHRPLDKNVLREIKEKLFLDLTYNSNAIEGNTLTLTETKVILEDGITIGGKSVREHLEAINHKEAIKYLEGIIKDNKKLSERQIKQLHYLIVNYHHLKKVASKFKTFNKDKPSLTVKNLVKHYPPIFQELDNFRSQEITLLETSSSYANK